MRIVIVTIGLMFILFCAVVAITGRHDDAGNGEVVQVLVVDKHTHEGAFFVSRDTHLTIKDSNRKFCVEVNKEDYGNINPGSTIGATRFTRSNGSVFYRVSPGVAR